MKVLHKRKRKLYILRVRLRGVFTGWCFWLPRSSDLRLATRLKGCTVLAPLLLFDTE